MLDLSLSSFVSSLPALLETSLIVIGSAATIVKALAVIAKITPSTKDDELASKAERVLSYISSFLDKLSLGLKPSELSTKDESKGSRK